LLHGLTLLIDEKEYAVKIIRKDKGYTPEMSTKIVELEANTMINLGIHPNLVKMVDANKAICCYRKANPECKNTAPSRKDFVAVREEINYLVLEKCSNGPLSKYFKTTGPFEELVSRFLLTQLCSAVHFMHTQEYVHLDIKLDNIMLDEYFNLKLGDLGIALCAKGTSQMLGHKRGTTRYMAPEVEKATSENSYNVFSADIYSVGVCLHLLLLGCYPTVGEETEGSTNGSHIQLADGDSDMTSAENESNAKF
jgi:serine/threonine protein kinase